MPSAANSIPAAELAEYLKTDAWRRQARDPDAWTVVVLDCCGSAVGVSNIGMSTFTSATIEPAGTVG